MCTKANIQTCSTTIDDSTEDAMILQLVLRTIFD